MTLGQEIKTIIGLSAAVIFAPQIAKNLPENKPDLTKLHLPVK